MPEAQTQPSSPAPTADTTPTVTEGVNVNPANVPDPIADVSYDLETYSRYGDIVPESVKDLLPNGGDTGGSSQQTATPPEGGTAPPADGGTPAQPATQPTQPDGGSQANNTAVQTQIANLTQLLQSPTPMATQPSQGQPQQQQPAQGDQKNPLENMPEYNFEIPDQLVNMMASEDPGERKRAMGALVKGVSQTIHQQVVDVIKHVQESMGGNITTQIQNHQAQQQVYNDFYGAYPHYNTPALRKVVHGMAIQLIQQDASMGVRTQWNKNFQQRLGDAVTNSLKAAGINLGGQQPAAQTTTNAAPANPPAAFGGTNGGGAHTAGKMAKGRKTQQDYMDDL